LDLGCAGLQFLFKRLYILWFQKLTIKFTHFIHVVSQKEERRSCHSQIFVNYDTRFHDQIHFLGLCRSHLDSSWSDYVITVVGNYKYRVGCASLLLRNVYTNMFTKLSTGSEVDGGSTRRHLALHLFPYV